MLTSTGHYISDGLTETGRVAVDGLTETGETCFSMHATVTGAAGISYDITGTMTVDNNIIGVVEIRLGSAGDNLLSCSVGIGISAIGTMSASKMLRGSAGISFDINGSLSTPNMLSGLAGVRLGVSGHFDKWAVITGSAGISLGLSGTISVPNRLAATVGIGLSASGGMSAPVGITGSIGISLAVGGRLTIPLVVTGSVGIALDATGTLWVSEDIIGDVGKVVADTITTWLMNTTTGGFAEYTNYPFNSFFRVGSDYYGCNSDGIHKLSGDNDNGNKINWSAKTGITTFGLRNKKNIQDARLIMRANGDVSLRSIIDEQIDRSNMIAYSDDRNGQHARRIKLAKGIIGTSWQFEISGEDSATIASLEVEPSVLQRT